MCVEKVFFLPLFFHWYVVWPFTVDAQLLPVVFFIFALSEIGLLTPAEDVSVFHSYFRVQNWV